LDSKTLISESQRVRRYFCMW